MQVLPISRQVRKLQPPGRPELLVPELLPLERRPELPLALLPELVPDDPEDVPHVPPWHDWLLVVQSWHAAPPMPHAELSVPGVHPRFGSQQPLQDVEHDPASSTDVPASPPATPASSPTLPPTVPPLEAPLGSWPPLLVEPALLFGLPLPVEEDGASEPASGEPRTTRAASYPP
jgi:hypothetical protein